MSTFSLFAMGKEIIDRPKDVSWWCLEMGESESQAAAEAIRGRCVSQGEITASLEKELARALGCGHVVATTSGSVALLMSMMALGVGPGDEVIVPDRTWIATAHAAHILGAKVVLVDVREDLPCLCPDALERAITPATKAIVPTHLCGRNGAIREALDAAEQRGIAVIEDACQAFASLHEGRPLGTFGLAGCFSLGITKLVATGQGGFIATDDGSFAEQLRLIRSHGVSSNLCREWGGTGCNFKFNDILASVGLEQLKRLGPKKQHVLKVYERYVEGLEGGAGEKVRMLPVDTGGGEVPLYVEVMSPQADRLVEHLGARGIQARRFLPSLHLAGHLAASGEYPCSMNFMKQGVFLPGGPSLPLEDVGRVIEAVRAFDA